MKQEMTLVDVSEFYDRKDVVQTDEGFEFGSLAMGLTMVVPPEFYRFMDGELLDPTAMMVDRMGQVRRILLRDESLHCPVSVSYIFGRFMVVDGVKKFFVLDPMETSDEATDALIDAEWDLCQGVSNMGWIMEAKNNCGDSVLFQKTIPFDAYETCGRQMWVLHVEKLMVTLRAIRDDFYACQRQIIESSDEVLRKFEAEKDEYRKKILEVVKEITTRHNFYTEASLCCADKTIIMEIAARGNGTSLWSKPLTFRHDGVGLTMVMMKLKQIVQKEEEGKNEADDD